MPPLNQRMYQPGVAKRQVIAESDNTMWSVKQPDSFRFSQVELERRKNEKELDKSNKKIDARRASNRSGMSLRGKKHSTHNTHNTSVNVTPRQKVSPHKPKSIYSGEAEMVQPDKVHEETILNDSIDINATISTF